MPDWTAAQLPSFAGRTVIVTGANAGLGEVTARELARVGGHVILAVRNTDKGRAAADRMAGVATGRVEVRELDLQDLASVRRFADGIDTVDVLVNNAGIMATKHAVTVDGFEGQIGTNHLGHFALTNLLLPKLTDRVVTVSSLMHHFGYISLKDLNFRSRPYSAWLAYSQSKLANLLFTSELQRRLDAVPSSLRAWPLTRAGRTPTCRGTRAANWAMRPSSRSTASCPPTPTSVPARRCTPSRRICRATPSSARGSGCTGGPSRRGGIGRPSGPGPPPRCGSCPRN